MSRTDQQRLFSESVPELFGQFFSQNDTLTIVPTRGDPVTVDASIGSVKHLTERTDSGDYTFLNRTVRINREDYPFPTIEWNYKYITHLPDENGNPADEQWDIDPGESDLGEHFVVLELVRTHHTSRPQHRASI